MLRSMVTGVLRDPVQFWTKMDGLPNLERFCSKSARKAIESLLPERGLKYRIVHRVAGLGSLGASDTSQSRNTVERNRAGSKALAPSGCVWAAKGKASERFVTRKSRIARCARLIHSCT